VRIKRLLPDEEIWLPDNTGSNSILFSGPVVTDHVAFCFDQNSYEVIGYQKTRTTIEVRRFFNSAVDVRTFEGIDPLLQYNGLLNDELEIDQTDVVCYYLKPDTNALFMRIQRDNFGTEYVACALPSRPLALKRAYYVRDDEDEAGTLVVEYVDAGLRIAQLFSAVYEAPEPPVPPPDYEIEVDAKNIDSVGVSLSVTGSYRFAVTYYDGLEFGDVHTPLTDAPIGTTLEIGGAYTPVLLYYDGGTLGDLHIPLTDAPTTTSLEVSGTYSLLAIPADIVSDSATVELSTSAEYAIGAIQIPQVSESASVDLTISATYEPA
jgi:hypothetical protein